jgi:hypothetical protein
MASQTCASEVSTTDTASAWESYLADNEEGERLLDDFGALAEVSDAIDSAADSLFEQIGE